MGYLLKTVQQPTTSTAFQDCPSELIYGKNSEKVEILRYFRDNVLAQTPEK